MAAGFLYCSPGVRRSGVQITSMTVAIWLLVFTRLLEGLSTASAIPATLSYISEATRGVRTCAPIIGYSR